MDPNADSNSEQEVPHSAVEAGRLFFRLIQEAVNKCDPAYAAARPYMQLAIYDLLGALFAMPNPPAIELRTRVGALPTDR
jgi:hypothetical protein